MKRHKLSPRNNWKEKAEEVGFTYHTCGIPSIDGEGTYWDESIAYEFSMAEVEEIENATIECQARCMDLVDKVVNQPNLMSKIGIPSKFHSAIKQSWDNDDPTLYGRFDFAYNGKEEPKMLEYNADTPTMVIETALMQWFWLQEVRPNCDQFNSLHEKLIEQFKYIKNRMNLGELFHFAGYSDSLEESQTLKYFEDVATQADLHCNFIDLSDIGWNGTDFVDLEDRPMKYWFKLYPWEWMMDDAFGSYLAKKSSGIIEPIWKTILSNKGMLPLLYEMFPDHPNILPASFENNLPINDEDWFNFQSVATVKQLEDYGKGQINIGNFVVKPMLSREGANIDLFENGKLIKKTEGDYTGPRIYQKRAKLYQEDGAFAVIGSWVVGDEPAGMIIRDHNQEIVQDTSKVVPHWIA